MLLQNTFLIIGKITAFSTYTNLLFHDKMKKTSRTGFSIKERSINRYIDQYLDEIDTRSIEN